MAHATPPSTRSSLGAGCRLFHPSGITSPSSPTRTSQESDGDNSLLVEIELLEMQMEAVPIDRALSDRLTVESKPKSSLDSEVLAWKRLLKAKNRPRAWIGALTMFF
ncbi:hypothetical protein DL96DRAFT_1565079 [Flagelloscypha sp. PMI_526]|nr:hypothetical protein DL96DRAFT_1565079 [Flagelloscypha sp. PMI_526]